MTSFSKSELAAKAGVSHTTFTKWLLLIEDQIPPPYSRHQKLLRPDQAAFLIRHFDL